VGASPLLSYESISMRLSCLRVLAPASLTLLLTAAASAQNWSDDFESYAVGSALEGQGGWEGWDGVNTTFTVVSSSFARSGTRSIQPNPGADTIYQFTPPLTGTWEFTGHVYIPTGFTSTLDYMVMNEYNHFGPYQWGSQITFNGASGIVTCHCGAINGATVGMPYDRWVEVRQVIDLDNDVATIYFDGVQFANYIWTGGYSGSAGHQVASIEAVDIYATMTGSGLYIDDISLSQLAGSIGTAYCAPAVPNSTGASSTIEAVGLTLASANDVTLNASSMPNNAFGYFLTSRTQGLVQNPGGSMGNLCLSGSIGRYVGPGQIKNSGLTGSFALQLDLTQTPTPTGFVTVMAGETWNFTTWHRDAIGGVATSNFTNGVSIAFN
jgi:hypothetical protein